nr:patched domain-containing protein 3-like [Cherax quadricarinatus]
MHRLAEALKMHERGSYKVSDERHYVGEETPGTAENEEGGGRVTEAAREQQRPHQEVQKTDRTSKQRWCVGGVSKYVMKAVETCCGWWGGVVAAHPAYTTLFVLLAAGLASLGLLNLQLEQRSYRLWIPHNSHFNKVNEWKMKNFPSNYRHHVGIWEARENILTARAVQSMWSLHQLMANLTLEVLGSNISWNNVCTRLPSLISQSNLSKPETSSRRKARYQQEIPAAVPTASEMSIEYLNAERNGSDESLEGSKVTPASDDSQSSGDGSVWPLKNANQKERQLMSRVSREMWEAARNDYSHLLPRGIYCHVLDSLPTLCYERSLLEVWGYHPHLIMNLTDDQVVSDINKASTSNVFGYPTRMAAFLGGIIKDASGRIVAARSALHTWVTKVKTDATSNIIDLGNGQTVDQESMAWEKALIEKALHTHSSQDVTLHIHAAHSFGAVSSSAIKGDLMWVFLGWAVMGCYVVVTLGHSMPALVGLLCVAMAAAASYGLCSVFGVPYGPITSLLPVLLVGLGVDDMYVIVMAWEAAGGRDSTIVRQGRQTLKKAGVAITLTTFTDVVAFLVGSSTQIPALRWFCIYAAASIAAVYLLQVTVFVAALARDKCCKATVITMCSNSPHGVLQRMMNRYARVVVDRTVAVLVVLAATALVAAGVWGSLYLKAKFNPLLFLPPSSYLYRWFDAMNRQFPEMGERGSIYFTNTSLPEDLPALNALVDTLLQSPYVATVEAWFSELDIYMYHDLRYSGRELTKGLLQEALGVFLHSGVGAKFIPHFVFNEPLVCSAPAPNISTFKINFVYQRMEKQWQQQAAMKGVRRAVEDLNVSGYHAVWAHVYSQWETDANLSGELWRNLGIVVGVVGVVTVVVVGTGVTALMVVGCVMATLVEVAAIMHVLNLAIDTITTIALVLSAGLCVDYAVHVAHAFLEAGGDRRKRVQAAVTTIGPAVIHAGVSTLIAFLALAPSHSHLFISFFKIFTGVSVLGLFHGLVVLPALLSLIGPNAKPLHSSPPSAPPIIILQYTHSTCTLHYTHTLPQCRQ